MICCICGLKIVRRQLILSDTVWEKVKEHDATEHPEVLNNPVYLNYISALLDEVKHGVDNDSYHVCACRLSLTNNRQFFAHLISNSFLNSFCQSGGARVGSDGVAGAAN